MLQYAEIPFVPTAKRLTNVYGAEPGTLAKASSDYFWLTIWDHTHQVLRKGFQLFRSPQPISKWTPTTGQAGDEFSGSQKAMQTHTFCSAFYIPIYFDACRIHLQRLATMDVPEPKRHNQAKQRLWQRTFRILFELEFARAVDARRWQGR